MCETLFVEESVLKGNSKKLENCFGARKKKQFFFFFDR